MLNEPYYWRSLIVLSLNSLLTGKRKFLCNIFDVLCRNQKYFCVLMARATIAARKAGKALQHQWTDGEGKGREARTASRDNRQEAAISFDDITVHPDSYEVDKNGERIVLSTKEFQVLTYLLNNHNQVLNREQIYQAVWGAGEFGDLSTVTVHIANLRKKLDPAGKYIKTVWGAGYKFSGGIAGRWV